LICLISLRRSNASSGLDSPNRYSATSVAERVGSAHELEIRLDDALVKQYYSGRLWVGYRGHSVLPYLLQSALMALENWLISFAECAESQKNLEWAFDYIIRKSNSVMPTAVLASVATGFPNKLGRAALPLLRTPELYNLDMARIVHERGGNEINWFKSGFQRDPLAEIYAEERRVAALRPWRKEHLETLIIRLQFSDLREKALTVIDELRSKTPEDEVWRFRFHRIDGRKWQAESDEENAQITLKPELEADLQEIQQHTQQQTELLGRFSTLLLWADTILSRETPEREYYADWRAALTEVKHLLPTFKNESSSGLARLHYFGIVKAAAVLLRDYSSQMGEEDVQWCAEIVIQAVSSNNDTDDTVSNEGGTDFTGAGAAASVLPLLLGLCEDEDSKLVAKQMIATALTHANPHVRAGTANGIREHLWQADPEFAQQCFLGAIEYSRLEVEISALRRDIYFVLSDSGETPDAEISAAVNDFHERLVRGRSFSFSAEEVGSLSFRTHSHWHLLNSCLMVPDGSTDQTHTAFISRLLTLFFEAEEVIGKHQSDRIQDDVSIHYKLRLTFTDRFAKHLMKLHEMGSLLFLNQILEGCDRAPEFTNYLLLNIALFSEGAEKKELYWEFWKQLSEEVQAIAIEIAQSHSEYKGEDRRRKLIRGMLQADAPWQKLDYERQDIALGKELILEFANNAGKNPDVFEAMTSLMFHFPRIFFEPGIHILARDQEEAGGCELLSGVNSAFYLEGAIQRFLLIDEPGPLSKEMHHSCLVLLDAVVETASPRAYYLREQLIRSRRIL
jgi:hypothetical protein